MGDSSGRTIIVPNEVFFAQVTESLSKGMMVTFTVKGWSMYPFFRDGKDKVCVERYDGRELEKGEIILFRYRGRYVLHRIYGIGTTAGGERLYRTVGDGNISGSESALPGDIAGVAVKRVTPSMKEWSCRSFSWRFLSALWMRLYRLRRWCLAVLRRIYR